MAHPDFTDRSFEQIARRALNRSSWGPLSPYREARVARGRLADASAKLGPHPGSSRAKDRRWAIHVKAKAAAALVAASMAEVA